jgi:hypothetical protein
MLKLPLVIVASDLSKLGKRITITDAAAMAMAMTSKPKKQKGILRPSTDFTNRASTQLVTDLSDIPPSRSSACSALLG